jgi:UDP-GlcNAc:undecaprenyl-phosphate GlcNAc-1-phosphate transferase
VDLWQQRHDIASGQAILLANGVVLFELSFLIVVRTARRHPFWRGSRDHFALRLQARGFSRWQVNAIAWLSALALGALAAATLYRPEVADVTAGIAIVGAALAWYGLLQRPEKIRLD